MRRLSLIEMENKSRRVIRATILTHNLPMYCDPGVRYVAPALGVLGWGVTQPELFRAYIDQQHDGMGNRFIPIIRKVRKFFLFSFKCIPSIQ